MEYLLISFTLIIVALIIRDGMIKFGAYRYGKADDEE